MGKTEYLIAELKGLVELAQSGVIQMPKTQEEMQEEAFGLSCQLLDRGATPGWIASAVPGIEIFETYGWSAEDLARRDEVRARNAAKAVAQ